MTAGILWGLERTQKIPNVLKKPTAPLPAYFVPRGATADLGSSAARGLGGAPVEHVGRQASNDGIHTTPCSTVEQESGAGFASGCPLPTRRCSAKFGHLQR